MPASEDHFLITIRSGRKEIAVVSTMDGAFVDTLKQLLTEVGYKVEVAETPPSKRRG